MPMIPLARYLQRAKRQQAGTSDRSVEIFAFSKYGFKVLVTLQLDTCVTRHDHRPRMDREFKLETKEAVHVGDNDAGKARAEFPEILTESRHSEMLRRDELQYLDIEIHSRTHPFTNRTLAPIECKQQEER